MGKVHFEGCHTTDSIWLKSLLETEVGATFHSETYESDLQRLRNLNLFFSVQGEWVVLEDNSIDVRIDIEEAIYVYPELYFGGFKGAFKMNLGLSTINWRGRGAQLGALYQYYDRHSFSIFQSTSRHLNGRTGHEIAIAKYATIEPLYFDRLRSNFNYDVYNVNAGVHYWLNYYTRWRIGGAYFYEIYNNRQNDIPGFPKGKLFSFNKAQIYTALVLDYRNYSYETIDGFFLNMYSEYVLDFQYSQYSFYKVVLDYRYFKLFGKYIQFASRLKFGMATNRNTPFLPFVIDGYLNIRGVGNRIRRGTAELTGNLEYRRRIYRHPLFILQMNIFSDVTVIRDPGQQVYEMFNPDQLYARAGLGGRLILQKWYSTILRVDYSHSLQQPDKWGLLAFGIGQFF